MKKIGIGRATGKIILIGEHSVVYGKKAIAFPFAGVGIHTTVQKKPTIHIQSKYFSGTLDEMKQIASMHNLVLLIEVLQKNLALPNFNLSIQSSIPSERGMGSSAAVAVSIVRAIFDWQNLALDNKTLLKYVDYSEQIAHDNPSGIDAAATSGTQPILFEKGQPFEAFPLNVDAYLLVADTGIKGQTRQAVKDVATLVNQKGQSVQAIIDQLGDLTLEAKTAIIQNQAKRLGQIMTASHHLLQKLTVSNQTLDEAVEIALDNHALGAKLTGGGRGGCLIVLAKDLQNAKQIQEKLISYGMKRTWLQGLGVFKNV
ncbi:MAG TPA: mevalonate kinase [Candidatus Enterococcus stercoripullorum]|nr:mevalonate kinase [Candidatus Enterococcus stercoripullorum]